MALDRKTVNMTNGKIFPIMLRFALAPVLGFKGICFAEPASWVISGALMVICYYVLLKKLIA